MESTLRRTWAEIDLDALAHNYRALRKQMGPKSRFLGVVKADAYGHGAIQVARVLEELGAEYLAISNIDEARELRLGGIGLPILQLGLTPADQTERILENRVTQAVWSESAAQGFSGEAIRLGGRMKAHIKLDTGMSRLGFQCDEDHFAASLEAICRVAALPGLELEGVFTHFAVSDEEKEESRAYTPASAHGIVPQDQQGHRAAGGGDAPAVGHHIEVICLQSRAVVDGPAGGQIHQSRGTPGRRIANGGPGAEEHLASGRAVEGLPIGQLHRREARRRAGAPPGGLSKKGLLPLLNLKVELGRHLLTALGQLLVHRLQDLAQEGVVQIAQGHQGIPLRPRVGGQGHKGRQHRPRQQHAGGGTQSSLLSHAVVSSYMYHRPNGPREGCRPRGAAFFP